MPAGNTMYPLPMPKQFARQGFRRLTVFRTDDLLIRYGPKPIEDQVLPAAWSARPWLGFVIRRRNGNAVARNRIKRVWRHQLQHVLQEKGPSMDAETLRQAMFFLSLRPDARIDTDLEQRTMQQWRTFLQHPATTKRLRAFQQAAES